jgi:peptidoglycan/LPS O-acetylase OafA/YrhL
MTVDRAPSKPLRFREIEHMRALAVLVVIVHHLGGMPGGFIGVDIFFVISGFVITHALLESSHLDLLSGLGRFYYRRIIRILPPLLLVTLASFALGWWLFFDDDFRRLQAAVSSQASFLQNLHFTRSVADYFRGIPSTDLALHTWSLAVEEQFYLLSPVLLILLIRLGRRHARAAGTVLLAVTGIATIAAVAPAAPPERLAAAVAGWFVAGPLDADALRFYSLPFRAWELLLGCTAMALRAHWHARLSTLSIRARPVFYAGLATLVAASFLDLQRQSWPNPSTLLICLIAAGCLMLVDTRPAEAEARVNLSGALAYVGSTSYSAYLWHWPLLGAFTYTNLDFGASSLDYVLYFVVLGALVTATYHTVERNRLKISRRGSAVVLAVFVLGALVLGHVERNPAWFTTTKQQILATSRYDDAMCESAPRDGGRRFVVLFGDSHARAVTSQLRDSASAHGYDLLCLRASRASLDSERPATEQALARLAAADGYAGTIMVMRWNAYSTGYAPYEVEERGNRFLTLDGRSPRDGAEALAFFAANMSHLVHRLAVARPGAGVALLLQPPTMAFFPQKESLVEYHGLRLRPLPPKSAAEHRAEQIPVRRVFEQLRAAEPPVSVLDPTPLLCDAHTCAYRREWNVLYKDDDHLSVYGETLLAPLFDRWLEGLDRGLDEIGPVATRPTALGAGGGEAPRDTAIRETPR